MESMWLSFPFAFTLEVGFVQRQTGGKSIFGTLLLRKPAEIADNLKSPFTQAYM